jgi:hypothetical protein
MNAVFWRCSTIIDQSLEIMESGAYCFYNLPVQRRGYQPGMMRMLSFGT